MLVNAYLFPGPALWQGIMFCVMPLFMWLLFSGKGLKKSGTYPVKVTAAYALFGVLLAGIIYWLR